MPRTVAIATTRVAPAIGTDHKVGLTGKLRGCRQQVLDGRGRRDPAAPRGVTGRTVRGDPLRGSHEHRPGRRRLPRLARTGGKPRVKISATLCGPVSGRACRANEGRGLCTPVSWQSRADTRTLHPRFCGSATSTVATPTRSTTAPVALLASCGSIAARGYETSALARALAVLRFGSVIRRLAVVGRGVARLP